jgi:hypothetical protein
MLEAGGQLELSPVCDNVTDCFAPMDGNARWNTGRVVRNVSVAAVDAVEKRMPQIAKHIRPVGISLLTSYQPDVGGIAALFRSDSGGLTRRMIEE